MHSHERFDALVVGAGPAGSVAALVLARGGARVALVDKARFPRDKACGDLVGSIRSRIHAVSRSDRASRSPTSSSIRAGRPDPPGSVAGCMRPTEPSESTSSEARGGERY